MAHLLGAAGQPHLPHTDPGRARPAREGDLRARIGIVCYPTAGGSGVVATELGKHLAERGHDISFISYASPLRLRELPPRVCFHVVDQDDHPLLKQFPHSLTIVGSTPSFKPVTEWSINESDAVTAVSAFLAAETGRQLSLRRPIAVVPRYEEIYQWVVGDAR